MERDDLDIQEKGHEKGMEGAPEPSRTAPERGTARLRLVDPRQTPWSRLRRAGTRG